MVVLIAGASHTGKTLLAQKLLEKHKMPYLSIDHLKMGLIRSGQTDLTPMDDDKLTDYLWPIVREMIKTAIENDQNLIVEGCYIPYGWREDFGDEYLSHIRCFCLVMTERYIRKHADDIAAYGSVIENRLEDEVDTEWLLADNARNLALCSGRGFEIILINEKYDVDIALEELV